MAGQAFKCNDIAEILEYEKNVKESCESFKNYLLILAVIKERYRLEPSLSQLLHFLEVNLFEQNSLVSICAINSRRIPAKELSKYNQLKLFDY